MACATCGSVDISMGEACSTCTGLSPEAACASCGADRPAFAQFCPRCGRPPVHAGLNAQAAHITLRSTVAPHMAARVLQQSSAMVGERKRVTVLFADIRGSTEMIDALDPEEALATIGPIMQILMDAVHAHDGFVNQTRGDGIMALFGAPLANENHAIDACNAALRMRAAVDVHARSSGRRVDLRIGLNSGEVVIQSIGTDLSMNFDAVGRTVHLASRLEKAARPGTILLSEDTAHLVRGFMDVNPAGVVKIKGLAHPVRVSELEAARPLTRWQVRKAQGLAPFKGRARERAVLARAMEAAEDGNGRLVVVTAPPGSGKSRLLDELIGDLPPAWQVIQVACAPQQASTSYHPIAQLLQAELGVKADTSRQDVRALMEATVDRRDPGLSPFIPALLSILDVRAPDAAWSRLDPGERRLKVLEAMRAGITSRAAKRPQLVVIEDAHWCDPETRHILEHIAGAIGSMPVLLVLTQRIENALRLPEGLPVTRLDLGPLDAEAARALAESLLGPDISLGPVRQRILDLADGNPLFIEELVQDLRDGGQLSGPPGNHRLAQAPQDLHLPDSIHSVIAARIDQLSADAKAVLQTAAVIGRQVPLVLLAHMLDRGPESLAAPLARLESAGLLYAAGDGREACLFKHELIRDVAYRTLLIETRRRLHAKAMEFIETAYADRIDEHIDRLADHAFEAHLWAKALPYQMRSCRRALRRGANQEAISICERALAALEHLPKGDERCKAGIDFRLAEIIALEPLGRHLRIASLLERASEKAAALKDPWRIAAVNCHLVVALWRIGRHDAAMEAAHAAETAASSIGDTALMFAALHNKGIVQHETGAFPAAIATFRECLAMETPDLDEKRVGWATLPSVMLRTFLADSLLEAGHITDAEAIAQEAAERAQAAGHAYSRVQINQVRAHILLIQGRSAEALSLLADDWQTVMTLDIVQMHPILAARLGQAHLARGNVRAALDILAQPERLDASIAENAFGWRHLFLTRAQAYLEDGQLSKARGSALRALDLALARGERPQEAHAHAVLADIAFAACHFTAARRHLQQARALAADCGMGLLAAHCDRQRLLHKRGFRQRLSVLFSRIALWRPTIARR